MADDVHLLFAVEGEVQPEVADSVAALVDELNDSRKSACGAIAFVNEPDETPTTSLDDGALWTLGGVLALTRQTDDPALERWQHEDVTSLIERLCEFTRSGPSLVIEYDGEAVGWIEDGRADESLRVGLLDEWRKRLP